MCELSSSTLEEEIEELDYRVKKNELKLKNYDMEEALDIQDLYIYGRPSAEAVERIKKSYDRMRVLTNDDLEFDREELSRKRKALSDSRLYASMDGIVFDLNRNLEGSTSKAGEVVMNIVDSSECMFEVEGIEYKKFFNDGEYVDMNIPFSAASGDYVLLPYDYSNWTDKMVFTVYTGPDNAGIEVGTRGTITVTEDEKKHVLSLPKDVVHFAGDDVFVYTLNEDNIRTIKYISIGLNGDDRVEITDGLSEGEKVVKK